MLFGAPVPEKGGAIQMMRYVFLLSKTSTTLTGCNSEEFGTPKGKLTFAKWLGTTAFGQQIEALYLKYLSYAFRSFIFLFRRRFSESVPFQHPA